MIRPSAFVGAGVAAATLVALDVGTKVHARSVDPTPSDPHREHEGPRGLGVAIIGATSLVAAGAVFAGHRLGANMPLVLGGAAALAAGGALNGAELLARGSNTNPLQVGDLHVNVADVGIGAGFAALGLAALPVLARFARS